MQSIKPIRPNSIVSANELNDIWQQMNSVESRFNPYENYIKKLQSEGDGSKIQEDPSTNKKDRALIEKHHIIPRFDGGTNDSSNLVLVSIKEHVISHWIRWRVLAKPQDYAAFLFRIGDIEEAISQRNFAVRAARERDKKEGRFMYNSEWQQEMGKRGGARGGSANTEQQYQARQQVGRQYGRQTGIKNQGQGLSEFISRYSIWAYSSSRNKSNKSNLNRSQIIMREFYCIIEPKSAFIDIINCLNALVPNYISLSAFSFFIL